MIEFVIGVGAVGYLAGSFGRGLLRARRVRRLAHREFVSWTALERLKKP